MNEHRLGLALLTASAVAWSTAGLFTRLAQSDVWTMLAWRGLFGALGIAVVILVLEGRRGLASLVFPSWPGALFAAVSAAGMIFFITALRQTSVAHVAIIYGTVPFVAASLGWLVLGETPTMLAVKASLAALAGVVVMVGFGLDGNLFGDLLAFAMTLSMAAMMVIARRFGKVRAMPAACLSALVSGLVCWPLGTPLAVPGHELALLAGFGLVNSAAGLTLFTLGARRLSPVETGLIGSLDAPLAPLWVWWLFGETPGAGTLAGGTIVFAAVAWYIVTDSRKRLVQLPNPS